MKRNKLILRGFILSAFLLAALVGVLFAGRRAAAEEYPDVPRYTITYNANGGEFAPETQYKYKDIPLTLATGIPQREGYVFDGWVTTVNPQTVYNPGQVYEANCGAKFYAVWKPAEFTISYNANGGEGAPESQKKKRYYPLRLSSQEPYREGYIFLGWSTTIEPNVIYPAGADYYYDRGAKFYAIWKKCDDLSGFSRVSFSGVREEAVSTDRFCYAEGERVVLLLDKGLHLPGDTLQNIEQIMEVIENKTGLSYDVYPLDYPFDYFNTTCETYFRNNPWEGMDFGKKVAILFVNGCCGDSSASGGRIVTIPTGQFFEDFVNTYYWNGELRDYYNFAVLAHELTHILTQRYVTLNMCVTEGSAEHISGVVIKELAGLSEDYAKSVDFYYAKQEGQEDDEDYVVSNLENPEELFITDCQNEGKYEPYHFGRILCEFLHETYGAGFLKDYVLSVKSSGLNAFYKSFTEEDHVAFTALFKETFGDDVFVRFGEWYQENIAR